MTGSRIFLDSSAWIGYFLSETAELSDYMDSPEKTLCTSILSIFEVALVLERLGWDEKTITKNLGFMREHGPLVGVEFEECRLAVASAKEHGLGAMDSLIYAAATKHQTTLLTLDNDYRGLRDVIVLEGKK